MASNEKSFPWDSLDDREYSADDFGAYYASLMSPGVLMTANFGDGLQITESASLGMRVKFSAGGAFSTFGRRYVHEIEEEVFIPIASTLQDRVDSIAIQFNKSLRDAFFVYKEADTTVTRTDSIEELQIAQITVRKNATQITNADIKDMRSDKTVCGYSSPYGELNVGDITAQFQAWFDGFKGRLGEDPATNLQLQVDQKANDADVVHKTGDEAISGVKTFQDGISVTNLEVSGDVPKTEIKTFWTNFKEYTTGVFPTYSVKNGRVNIQGALTPKTSQAGGATTNYGTFYLPSGIIPPQDIVTVSQGSGYNRFTVIAGTDGVLRVGRYSANGTDVAMSPGNWLPFSVQYDL